MGKDLRFIELFAGIGGFRYGLEQAGNFQCVYTNEWDQSAADIYERNFHERPDTRDITTVDAREIPSHDILTGGFPCQAFSIAGQRRGFDDTRGTLFFEIARIASHHRPRYLLLENVKGLLSHDSGKTFATILRVLADLGYRVEWQLLNSKHFGVPQNRERVFIIGHYGRRSGPQVFPIEGSYNSDLKEITRDTNQTERVYDPSGASPTLNCCGGGNLEPKVITRGFYGEKVVRDISDVSATLTRGALDNYLYYPDLSKIRKLTPTECEKLQGFPVGWTEGFSDSARYKALGNAVTTNVITAIGKRLMEVANV